MVYVGLYCAMHMPDTDFFELAFFLSLGTCIVIGCWNRKVKPKQRNK